MYYGTGSVALYYGDSQSITDAADSANYITTYGTSAIIADHNYQTGNAIKSLSVGDSIWIKRNGTVTRYECTMVDYNGHNTGSAITDSNYNSLMNTGKIVFYTCNGNWTSVTVLIFERR